MTVILITIFFTFMLSAGFLFGRLSHKDQENTRTCKERMLWHIRDERQVLQNVRTHLRSASSVAKSSMALHHITSAISHIDVHLKYLDATESSIVGVDVEQLPHK